MIETWERSVVTGSGAEGLTAAETVIHRRDADVMQMAMRRNPELAACSRIEIRTVEAFLVEREGCGRSRRKDEIPRDEHREEEWDW